MTPLEYASQQAPAPPGIMPSLPHDSSRYTHILKVASGGVWKQGGRRKREKGCEQNKEHPAGAGVGAGAGAGVAVAS